ncbi:MAG: hypothetical protein KatS3mg081_2705 [Gemmatimonadales bacterium]|nr:MAG: hypothetical protein KatS3mg081_2705 [Gemmatimonadales bacterium]
MWLTHPVPGPLLRAALRQAFARHVPGTAFGNVVVRIGAYAFDSLASWRDRLLDPILDIDGVTSLDLDEERNRLVIGVSSQSARPAVLRELSRREVPPSAVVVEAEEEAAMLLPDEASVPSEATNGCPSIESLCRPLWAGLQIGRRKPGDPQKFFECTIGLIATIDGVRVFITASHCSTDKWSLDNTIQNQPYPLSSGDVLRIGGEWRDPNAPGCGFLGIANCRYSDASAFRLDGGIHGEGTVARPQTVGIWPTPSGGFAIDPQNPSWPIKGPASTSIYVNMLLQKVGAGTGWTRGPVSKTCKDVKTGFFGLGHRLYCQHFVQVGSNKGDSGSPVFTMADSDGAVFVMGIGILALRTCSAL